MDVVAGWNSYGREYCKQRILEMLYDISSLIDEVNNTANTIDLNQLFDFMSDLEIEKMFIDLYVI